MKKLQWYSQDSIGVHPVNFHPGKDSTYGVKENGTIKTDSLFKLKESKYDGEYWVEDIYGMDCEDPDDFVDVEIVEIELTEKK